MSQIQLGCRVAINSFKNKNQEGIIKFIGEVKGKLGEWVGIELEEAKGDMDGTNNGVFLFQCDPGCGLLLRATQLKVIAPPHPDFPKQVPQLDMDQIDVSESPLLTPKYPPPQFQKNLQQVVTQQTLQQLQKISEEQENIQQQKEKPAEGKALGWKERLEKLREQKAKKATDEEKKVEELVVDPDKEKIKEIFAPATGIKRTIEGRLEVDKDVMKATKKETEILNQETIPTQSDKNETTQEESKKTSLAQRIGGGIGKGLKGPQQMKTPTTQLAQPTNQLAKINNSIEATKARNDQVKEKLLNRQTSPSKITESGKDKLPARQTSPQKIGTQQKPLGLKKPEAGKEQLDKSKTESISLANKIGMKKLATATIATAATLGDKTGQKPLTARGKEEEKKEPLNKKTVTQPPTQTTTLKDSKTKIVKKENSAQIIEEDENLLIDDIESQLQSHSPPKKEVTQIFDQIPQQFGGISQVEYKKLETSLRKKNDEAYALQIEVRELSSKIETLQESHKQELDKIEKDYDSKLLALQAKLKDNSALTQVESQAKQQEQELLAQIEEIKKQKLEAEQIILQQQKQIEEQEKEKQRLLSEIEAKNVDIESIQLELDLLKDEKEELLNQLKMSTEISDDGLESLNSDELRSQNQKLRQAITTLSMNYESEKSKYEDKIAGLQEKANKVDEYEKKLEDMDLLIEEVELKEQERLDMEKKLEECLEYEQMVEEMTQELLRKEEENEELLQKIIELEEMNNVAEELNENQEQYVKELNEEIADRDAKISNINQSQKELEELVLDIEGQMNRYKEKCQELKQKCKILDEELQAVYSKGDSNMKISTLLDKQNQLMMKLREANKKDIELNNFQIEFWQEKMKSKVIQEFIPSRLHEETKLDSLDKIQLLNKARNKAMLLIREMCEKQILNVDSLHDDLDQRQNYTRILISISEEAIKLIDISNKIMLCIYKMSIEKYEESTKLLSWNKYITVCQFIDKILELLKEESLNTKFDISVFVQSVKSLQDLQATIEFKYTEEENQNNQNNQSSPNKRQKELKKSNKFTIRNEILKMAIGVIVLASIVGAHNDEIRTKCKLIYWRLIDIILKIDYIEGSDQGEEYLNIEELNLDVRMQQKYNTIRILWTAMDEAGDSLEKDWSSVLEAIERDITQLGNDYKFKKLINKFNDEVKEQKIDDLYKLGFNSKGPWTLISNKIRQDLEETDSMKEKIEQLIEKQKEQSKQYLLLKREKDEICLMNQSLEKRLGEAISKTEKVQALEIEKKDLLEKEQHLNQQIEQAKKEIESLRQKEKALKERLAEAEYQAESPDSKGKKSSALKGRSSHVKAFYEKLQQSSKLSRGSARDQFPLELSRQASTTEMQRQLFQNEEIFTNIITELQQDRMKLKGNNMMERLNKLTRTEGALNEYIRKQKEKKELTVKLSKDEQEMIENALPNIEILKNKVKKELVSQKVIDLTQKREFDPLFMNQQQQSIAQSEHEKINYLILKAKEEVNNVTKVLFSKDSKFHKIAQLHDEVQIKSNVISSESLVKIGSLKLRGLIPNLASEKKVLLLDKENTKELKRNLAIFAN